MKPPTMVSKKVEPKKLVSVLAEVEIPKDITWWKYSTKMDMFATNPIFSKVPKTASNCKIFISIRT